MSSKRVFSKPFRSIDYNLKDMYKYYKKTMETTVNYKTFIKVIKTFNYHFVDSLLHGEYLELPNRIGDIFIQKYEPKFKFDDNGNLINHGQHNMIDYKATKKLWEEYPELAHKQRVFYTNEHSDGFKFKIKWKKANVKNIRLYSFIPAKNLKKSLAKFIRNNPNQNYYGD